ncbi:MAG: TetR/AcrR family transcriptional regulator [Myxococcales bacterium]|nr:TetR/AcrR family transcriptional regulator [Myxococcales bacterium]
MTSHASKKKGEASSNILRAAEEPFASKGFAAVSVRDIAQLAKVNKALVFYYYDNKATLLRKVLEQYYAAHVEALSPTDAELSLREQVHALLTSYLDFIEDNSRYIHIVQHELLPNGENLKVIRDGMTLLFARVKHVLGELSGEGALHARQFFLSFSGLVVAYFTYAPVLDQIWDSDPLSASNRRERREHLHWVIDQMFNGLEASKS